MAKISKSDFDPRALLIRVLKLRAAFLTTVLALTLAACTVTQPMMQGEKHGYSPRPQSQTQNKAEPEESRPEQSSRRLLVMPADVEIYELTAGGLQEPKADWTEKARQHINEAIKTLVSQSNAELLPYRARAGINIYAPDHVQLVKLHEAVGRTIMLHTFRTEFALPSKKGVFDWSLGDAVVSLREDYDADYVLFVHFRDSFASGGRVGVMVIGALLGVGIQGGHQSGFASLVDLRTGKVAWFNRLFSTVGDLREPKQALSATDDLLEKAPLATPGL